MKARGLSQLIGVSAAVILVAAVCAGQAPTDADVLVQGNLPKTFGLRFGPEGHLYVCSIAGIAVLDVVQGQMVDLIGPERGVNGPEDVNFGPDGSMYWAQMFTGEIGRRAPDGTITHQMIGIGVNSIVLAPDGRLFVTEPWVTDSLFIVDPELQDPPLLLAQGLGGVKSPEFGPGGLLYAALWMRGEVVTIDVETTPPSVEAIATALPGPFTARFGPDGMLYVVERQGFTVQRMDPTNGTHTTYVELPFGPDNIAFAPNGALFVSSYTDGAVAVALPNGAVQTIVPGGLSTPSGLTVVPRPDGESLFVGDLFALREYDTATGAELSTVRMKMPVTGFGGAISVAATEDKLLLSNFFPVGRIQVWDPQHSTVVEEILDLPTVVNAIPFGEDLVAVDLGTGPGEARVVRIAAGGTTVLVDATDQIMLPLGLVAKDNDLWCGDWATGVVWQLVADGTKLDTPVPLASGLSGPEGMAFDLDGSLLVVEGTAGRVSRIRLATGAVTPVVSGLDLSATGAGMLPPFSTLNGIAVGSSGAIYVSGDLGVKVYKLVPQTWYLPGAANVAGMHGSQWTTDVELVNRGADQASYTVELLVRGHANPAPEAVAFELAPGHAVRYANVLDGVFDIEGAGTLRITSLRGDLLVSARTATAGGGGSYGQRIEAVNTVDAAGVEEPLYLIQLQNGATARTNIGLVNASAGRIQIQVELMAANGTLLGVRDLELEAFASHQINDVFSGLGPARSLIDAHDAYAIVSSATDGAAFFAYASVVDNVTNDPVFVPGR